MQLTLLQHLLLPNIPSASGIVKLDAFYYIIGDNSPYLFQLNQDFTLHTQLEIYPGSQTKNGIIPKPIKPDFECIESINEREILILGSGSKSPQRDLCIHISLQPFLANTYSLSPFYNSLKALMPPTSELNIEATALSSTHLYVFNRSTNVIFTVLLSEFLAHLPTNTPCPIVHTISYNLPHINGKQAGFSGASLHPNLPILFFTASVENTDNAYDDGAILGSFIGQIRVENNIPTTLIQTLEVPLQNPPLKLEGICFSNISTNNKAQLLCVSDPDGAASSLIEFEIEW